MGKSLVPATSSQSGAACQVVTDLCYSAFCVKVDTTAGSSQPLAPSCREADTERAGSPCA